MSESNPSNDYTPLDAVLAEYVMRIDRGEQVDREQFIGEHPELADELRAYFNDVEAVDKMLDSAAEGISGEPQGEKAPLPLGLVRYFGDYELLEEIGRGGMGVVYKARQTSLARTVAVKMILAGKLSRREDVERFHREAAAAAQLQHRSIVGIHEVGEHEGQHYFSMDFIEGRSLDAVVRENPLPAARAARYTKLIAEAVECAHRQGILHRDLKPSNVLIDQHDVPIVTDFGLAKEVESGADLTATGAVLGSPSYMSPEQALGNTKMLRATSDVYSLGATFYELLTGRPPFRADSPAATLLQVVSSEAVSPRMLNPAIDRDVETICLKCLEKVPSQRYESAQALADDLGRYLEGRPILARPIGRPARFWRWCKRNPMVAGLTAAIFVLLVLGTAISTSLAVAAKREANRATAEAERATLAEERTSQQAATREAEALGRLADRGDSRGVLKGLDSPLLARYGDPVQLALWRVDALTALNRDKEAVEAVEQLASSEATDKRAGEIMLLHGDVLRLKDAARSKRLIDGALRHNLPPADAAYANALLAKTVPEAAESLKQAVRLQPFHRRANALLAMNLVALGRTDEAKPRALAAQCLFPEDPSFPVVLALAAVLADDKIALEQHLHEIDPLLGKEQVSQFRSLLETATRWRAILGSDNDSVLPQMLKDLPLFWANSGSMWGPADRERSGWMKSSPPQLSVAISKSMQAFTSLMSSTVFPGGKDAAFAPMAEATEILPIAPLQMVQGGLLMDAGRFDEAGKVYLKAAQSPEFVPGLRRQAAAYAGMLQLLAAKRAGEKGNALREEGLRLFEESIRLGGPPPGTRSTVCQMLLKNNHSRLEVHQFLERDYAKNPQKPDSLLAWSHQLQGNYYRALQLAEQSLKKNAKDALAQQVRTECLQILKAGLSEKDESNGKVTPRSATTPP